MLDALEKGMQGKAATTNVFTTLVLSSPEFQRR
jgi:hypothetical protein